MKTKEWLSRQPPLAPPYPRRGTSRLPSSDEEGSGAVRLCDRGGISGLCVRKMGEQSENVDENKGQVQKVAKSCSARPNADRTSSGRRSEGGGRLLDFWTPPLVARQNRGNKAGMSMKTKDKVNKSSSRAQSSGLTYPSPGSPLSPPSPNSGVRWTPSGPGNRTPQRRGLLVTWVWLQVTRGGQESKN